MAEKKMKMYLIDYRKYEGEVLKNVDFGVEKTTNSTLIRVGEPLSEGAVNNLIDIGWEVEIRAPQSKDFK